MVCEQCNPGEGWRLHGRSQVVWQITVVSTVDTGTLINFELLLLHTQRLVSIVLVYEISMLEEGSRSIRTALQSAC